MYEPSLHQPSACYPFPFIPLRPFRYCFPLTNTLARPFRTYVFKGLPCCSCYTPTNPQINSFWLTAYNPPSCDLRYGFLHLVLFSLLLTVRHSTLIYGSIRCYVVQYKTTTILLVHYSLHLLRSNFNLKIPPVIPFLAVSSLTLLLPSHPSLLFIKTQFDP